jgi:pimeloyl-ACP methyl ester carboxylesterase
MQTMDVQKQEQTIRLRDGRLLAYAEFGDPSGIPLLFCHGWGDSRLTRHPDDARTAALGIRLITVDRPGFGRSDFQPRRTLLDWPADIV